MPADRPGKPSSRAGRLDPATADRALETIERVRAHIAKSVDPADLLRDLARLTGRL